MDAARYLSVGPTRHRVANVDNHFHRVGWRQGNEGLRFGVGPVFDFEAAGAVLEQQGDGAKIGVDRNTARPARLHLVDGNGGVVSESEIGGAGYAACDQRPVLDSPGDLYGL